MFTTTAHPVLAQDSPSLTSLLTTPVLSLALDLETGDADETAIAAAIATWNRVGNTKAPDKLAARRAAAATQIRAKAALLDASPILCLALQTEQGALVWNGMDAESYAIEGWTVLPCGDEHGLLLAFRQWAEYAIDPATVIVGHNHRGFDLPKLRAAYVRHRLRLPAFLSPHLSGEEPSNARVDTMSLFKAFSMEYRDERFISLQTVAQALDVPRPKQVVAGADIPRLHREGQHHTVLVYCCVDAATTYRAYQLMTSQASDLS